MTDPRSFSTTLQAAAIIGGAFLAGTMMSLSIMTIPLFLDTNTSSSHLLLQWDRLYSYGHIVSPITSVIVCLLYMYKALQKPQRRALYILAGLVTVGMIPFTLTVMWNTNETLFALVADDKAASLGEVQELVANWGRMHFVRSCFPLAGAAIGFAAVWQDFADWPLQLS